MKGGMETKYSGNFLKYMNIKFMNIYEMVILMRYLNIGTYGVSCHQVKLSVVGLDCI